MAAVRGAGTWIVVALLGLVACASEPGAGQQPDACTVGDAVSAALTPSEQCNFAAHFVKTPDPPSASGNALAMDLYDRTGAPVAGATVHATAWMPAMGHGSTQPASATDNGNGHYAITGLLFTMPGAWQVQIDVATAGVQDRFTLAYTIQ